MTNSLYQGSHLVLNIRKAGKRGMTEDSQITDTIPLSSDMKLVVARNPDWTANGSVL